MSVRELLDRYGPTMAVLAVLGLLAVLVPGNAPESEQLSATGDAGSVVPTDSSVAATVDPAATTGDVAATDPAAGTAPSGGSAPTPGGAAAAPKAGAPAPGAPGAAPAAAAAAPAAPAGLKFGSGPNCREDGRMKQMSTYSPPCVDWKPGTDNGGATARGVTKDKIIVTWFRSQSDPATDAALQAAGATDNETDQRRIYASLVRHFNHHNETYGREVVIKEVQASGKDTNEAAMKSDALKIAKEIGAFANYGGPNVLAAELAQLGVVCACTTSAAEAFYTANPPYIFASLPTLEDYYIHFAEYIGKRLANKPAKHAGDPTGLMQRNPRKFGLIYYEGRDGRADPDYKKARDVFVRELAKYGVTLSADVGYLYQIENAGGHSEGMITKMKAAGVSNLLFVGDPLYPVFVTKEATRQGYFPEWFISGTSLIDTSFFGRTYDQAQWSNAFGISPLWVFHVDVSTSSGYQAYHHATPGARRGDEGVGINVYQAPIQLLFNGIHMAGPNLTADTFSKGLLAYPKTGGKAAAPLVYFTRESPNAIKDFTEVFWSPTQSGKDETGKDAPGVLLKAEKGRRYQAGQWPAQDPKVFEDAAGEAVYTDDNPPGGPATVPHAQDGHTHDFKNKACLSCSGPPSG
jgi:hypothetical protein